MPLIEAKNIHKIYGSDAEPTAVLKGLDLSIEAGESVAIVGSSGAGKSTLLHILGTLERPTAGQIFFDGQDLALLSDNQLAAFRNQSVGFVFQFHHLLGDFTALENIMMPLLIRGINRKTAATEALTLLQKTGLMDRAHHRPGQLSGGEQQRVALARALVAKPKLLLADEPTGNLDHENGVKIFDLLLSLNRELRTTLVVVSHNQDLANRLNRIVTIVDGKIS